MIVKVATFRNAVDHLFRVVNVDYHACVGASELRNWQGIAGRVAPRLERRKRGLVLAVDLGRKRIVLLRHGHCAGRPV